MQKDPFRLHRLALAPFLDSENSIDFPSLLAAAENEGINDFLQFLIFNGLAPLWHDALIKTGQINTINPEVAEKLRQVRLVSEANYLNQKNSLEKVHNSLSSADIEYAVLKGAQVRELVYDNPGLRPCADIDILITRKNRDLAIRTLIDTGLSFHPNEEVFSHECMFVDKTATIDLHWNIMRTGRTRIDLTESLLNESTTINGIKYLNNEASLFVLLVHPAFNKYICSKDAIIIRLVDLYRYLSSFQFNWNIVSDLIRKGGVNTAAWSTLYWLSNFTTPPMKDIFCTIKKPYYYKRKYIEYWVDNDLPTKLYDNRLTMRLGLSVFLHDNLFDSLRAIWNLFIRERVIPQSFKSL